jgi:hypothetical protein
MAQPNGDHASPPQIDESIERHADQDQRKVHTFVPVFGIGPFVRVGDDIYVRAYKGRTSPWFRGIQTRHEGHIRAGGVEKDVTFVEETNADINDKIDSAYLRKYCRYPTHVAPMVTADARAATIKLVPGDNH